MLPVRIVMWSVGTSCFMKEKSESLVKKVLTHPCIVAIYLGLLVMIAGISFPVSVENTISGISSCNTPLSMMLVGMMLAEMNPKGILDGTMVLYTIVRLILIPAILFGLTALLPSSIQGTKNDMAVPGGTIENPRPLLRPSAISAILFIFSSS